MRTRDSLALCLGLTLVASAACRPRGPSGPSEAELPAPAIAHGPASAYAGTWVGPALRLSFVGPWVLVRPTDDPAAAPIEMRVVIEREQGDAFALRTTLAAVFPADFLRPSDWTMLVEDGQLALAMGDEPLTPYTAAGTDGSDRTGAAPAPLLGPTMISPDDLPEQLVRANVLTCLEHAADACASLEAGGPLLAGCRELHWGDCIVELGPPPADPTARAAAAAARELRRHARALAFTRAIRRAYPEREAAAAAYARAVDAARRELAALEADDAVPESETEALSRIRAALTAADASGPPR